jgi:hypothetical protein
MTEARTPIQPNKASSLSNVEQDSLSESESERDSLNPKKRKKKKERWLVVPQSLVDISPPTN